MGNGAFQRFVSLVCAVEFLLIGASAALGQENLFQITRVGNGETVQLPPDTTGRADFDQTVYLEGTPEGSVLTAPQDDAVIVAHQGAVVHLSDVVLQKTGNSRFGIYVNGGRVELEDCQITGGFDTGIYVASGSVSLANCLIEGGAYGIAAQAGTSVEAVDLSITGSTDSGLFVDQGRTSVDGLWIKGVGSNPLYLSGPGEAELFDLEIDGNGQSRVVLLSGLNASVDGLRLTGSGGEGVIAQNTGHLDFFDVATSADLSSGLIVQGATSVILDSFALGAMDQPMQVSRVAEGVEISGGQIIAGPNAYAISVFENGFVDIDDVSLIGGDIGVFAEGPIGQLSIADSRISSQNTYGVLLQNMGGTAEPTWIEGNRITAAGEALTVAALDGGFVGLHDNVLVTEGPTAVYLQNSALAENSDNLIVSAPQSAESTVLFYPETDQVERQYLTDGPVVPVEGWFDENVENTVLSHVRVLKESDDDDLRRAIAGMVAGVSLNPAEVLDRIALEATLAEEAFEDAGDLVTVSLAPPQVGWKWSDEAIGVVLEPLGGSAEVYFPDEFPIQVARGQYRLMVDGTYLRVLNLTDDVELNVGNPAGPFAVWRDEDSTIWRGPGLQLRRANALKALADGLRPLEIGEFYGRQLVKIRRAGLTDAQVSQAVATARQVLPELLPRMVAERDAERWESYNRLWTVQRMYFDILGALGDWEDLEWIHQYFADQDLQFQSMYAAVQIEQRLGLRADSPNMAFALTRLEDDPTHYQARQMLTMLSRTGDAAALSKLVELHEADAAMADALTLASIGVAEAFDLSPSQGLPIHRAYLTKLKQIALAKINGADVDYASLDSPEVWRNATRSILYLSKHGTNEDAALFDLPVPVSSDFYPLSAILAHPGDAVEAYYGAQASIPEYRINSWQTRYGEMVCPALSLSTPDRRDRVLFSMNWAMRGAVLRTFYPDFWQLDSRTRQGAETSLRMIDEMSRAHCGMTETVIDLAMGEDSAGEFNRKLRQSDLNPQWWVRPSWAAERMAAMGRQDAYVSVEGLSPYPTEQLMEMLQATGSGEPEMAQAFGLWHSVVTDAYQTPQGFFPFGSERRVFRLRNEGGNGTLSIGGIVDLRLLPDAGTLTVAINNNILSPDYGGLAAMMTAPDRDPYEANNHRNMIASVGLERDGLLTEGSFVQTLDGGVHVFEIPFDGDLSNTYLRVGMQFLEDHWPLDYALFDSQLSYAQNLAKTGEGVE